VSAMTIPARTITTVATCVQIQNGDRPEMMADPLVAASGPDGP